MVKTVGTELVKVEENGRFVYVASKSRPGEWHNIWGHGEHLHCSCKGHQFRGHCRHIVAFLAWRRGEYTAA